MIPIFDSGHGGLIKGVYQTPGKRSADLGQGVLYEGAFNRWMKHKLMEMCDRIRIPYLDASPGHEDISLRKRVNAANRWYAEDKSLYFVSIHANAGGGTGSEIFTSPGQTTSDIIAEMFFESISGTFPGRKMRADRTDGDSDKEAGYAVLTATHCPAVLIEIGFMDTRKDYDELWSAAWRERMCEALFETILYLSSTKI